MILDIFAQRARSFEGKLQVELAQLSHLSTRLVRGLDPPRAAEGRHRAAGPGRDAAGDRPAPRSRKRIRTLRARLEKLARQRDTGRHVRREVPVPTVALVGYTNAGKSTLFNALTGSATYVADQLFATLDPTVRRIKLSGVGEVVLADTVGFVRALPHELVAAFRSTLQEARDADLLLHVVDASDPLRDERIEQVREVLRGIGAGEIRELLVFNKIDLAAESAAGRGRRRRHPGAGVGIRGHGRGPAAAARSDRAGGATQPGAAHAAPRHGRGRGPLGPLPAQCGARRAPVRRRQLGAGRRTRRDAKSRSCWAVRESTWWIPATQGANNAWHSPLVSGGSAARMPGCCK